ncbi:ABC transporter ATP-binding protein [Variovorax sp. J31P179]|uniref:ABC transporter ATP-binding protein n=1 Tax=Variovorax sp. J31P179 TaxID=3053508 RepID=UPI002576BCD8|nr:ABC transporter ATP-binding protein [Variovorax sp. J31P179]MDM0085409.1 ABC transporter ATP-binding protein [Variovorax sp. J31P179]
MLSVDRLDAHYGLFQALFGLSFEIGAGETVALIGANGAGKSTLLKAIVGAIRVRRDGVLLDRQPVGGDAERLQLSRGVALVPEGRRLFPSLTVKENLQLAARNGRRGPWTVERVVREFPVLASFLDRPATALSGGQQQLVAISRALVCNPRLLLCDEISLGLSPLAVNEVYDLLAGARKDGLAVVLVEQNVQRALAESDRYYCIQKGRTVLSGRSDEADRAAVAKAYFGV